MKNGILLISSPPSAYGSSIHFVISWSIWRGCKGGNLCYDMICVCQASSCVHWIGCHTLILMILIPLFSWCVHPLEFWNLDNFLSACFPFIKCWLTRHVVGDKAIQLEWMDEHFYWFSLTPCIDIEGGILFLWFHPTVILGLSDKPKLSCTSVMSIVLQIPLLGCLARAERNFGYVQIFLRIIFSIDNNTDILWIFLKSTILENHEITIHHKCCI